jgi:hemerythrin-like domain-containing protein
MSDPIDILMEDHRTIESVLAAIRLAARKQVPVEFYADVVDFIVNYADGLHHAREEDRLFPLMEQRGIPRQGGPIGVMCAEHVMGREHVARMREQLAAGDLAQLRLESRAYAALLEGHIEKEDVVLFPMGRSVLAPEELERLRAEFQEVDPGGEVRARYVALAASLRERAEAAPEL